MRQNAALCGNGLSLSQTSPGLLRVCSTSLLKTLLKKEKLLVISHFSSPHNVFYSFVDLSTIFVKFEIVVCKLFQFGRVQNLLFGKGLKASADDKNISQIMHTSIFSFTHRHKYFFTTQPKLLMTLRM